MKSNARGWNVTVSLGDLSHVSGYRTRVLGALQHLDSLGGFEPFLLLFDRAPREFAAHPIAADMRSFRRSHFVRFYTEIHRLHAMQPVRLVHAHNLYSAALALSARPLHGFRVVLDYHGRVPEEYVYLKKGGATSQRALEILEYWVARQSDHVVVVSEKLRSHLMSTCGLQPHQVTVIPCVTDSDAFTWNPELRERTRHRLGLAHSFVCVHLGSFFDWYEPELLISTFERIRMRRSDAHLLVVSRNTPETRAFLDARLPGKFTFMEAAHADVPALLNAADVGFLLLRAAPNIRTSSPVKFAEYLACGLPVLMTPDVGDYSDLIANSGAGAVLDIKHTSEFGWLDIPRNVLAERAQKAGAHLTWRNAQSSWNQVLNQLQLL